MSGITWFITQQARYQHFANVYAAIIMIGILGLGTDMILALSRPASFPGTARWASRREVMRDEPTRHARRPMPLSRSIARGAGALRRV